MAIACLLRAERTSERGEQSVRRFGGSQRGGRKCRAARIASCRSCSSRAYGVHVKRRRTRGGIHYRHGRPACRRPRHPHSASIPPASSRIAALQTSALPDAPNERPDSPPAPSDAPNASPLSLKAGASEPSTRRQHGRRTEPDPAEHAGNLKLCVHSLRALPVPLTVGPPRLQSLNPRLSGS